MLQRLVSYYESLAEQGRAALPGWSNQKIAYALELNAEGRPLRMVPLSTLSADGKKTRPRHLLLPAKRRHSSDITANFLWDNFSYVLGFDGKGDPERTRKCFEASREHHKSLLGALDDAYAVAIVRFFETWNPDGAEEKPLFADSMDDILKGANITFLFDGSVFPAESAALRAAWQKHYDGDEDRATMRCLVTGESAVPAMVHPAIKGVQGAQSSGAALCSYNAPAFCSFEREQNLNAPVGKYAAFAYTTALNMLLSDSDHVRRFGDTTVVFWVQSAEAEYQDAMSAFLDGESDSLSAEDLRGYVDKLSKGEIANWQGVPLHPENHFFLLGVSPNAARLSVRFFLEDSFGHFAQNLNRFYEDTDIAADYFSKGPIPLWRLLRETVNPNARDKTPSPQVAGDTLRAILTGGMYPAALYQQTQIRIRAERNPSRGRMAIVKAYLSRIQGNAKYREGLTVELNENTAYQPYVLGRMFAVLEAVQRAANPDINTTIRDKYFTSACATPAIVFPTLINLAQKHLRKLNEGAEIYYSKQLTQLANLIASSYPNHHTLYEQGVFQLGYYHQVQKIYTKKDKAETEKGVK